MAQKPKTLSTEIKEARQIAMELGYPSICLKKLLEAKSINEVSRIMTTFRQIDSLPEPKKRPKIVIKTEPETTVYAYKPAI